MTLETNHTPRRTTSKLVAVLAAASIAVAGLGATPAQAGGKDAARTLAVIAGVLLLGKVISDNNKKRRRRHAATPAPQPNVYYGNTLPLQCVRWVDSDRGAYRVLGKRCIENRVGAIQLPRSCKRIFWGANGRQRTGYGRRCLLNSGYRIEPISR